MYGAADAAPPSRDPEGTVGFSLHKHADVLICGSTLFACQLALDAAAKGFRTVLVMDRVNPFLEGIACLRPWLAEADAPAFPAVVRGVLDPATSENKDGRIYFNASKAALEIEDRLTDAGVRFLYNASVAGALARDGKLAGVVFGGKTGFFGITAGTLVDATLDATVARAAGAKFMPLEGPRRFHYAVDLSAPVEARTTAYQAAGGASVALEIHHYFAGFDIVFDSKTSGPLAFSEDFNAVYAASLEAPWTGSEKRFRGADAVLTSGTDKLDSSDGTVAGFENLLVFGPHGIRGNTEGSLVLKDWKALFAAFPNAVERIAVREIAPDRPGVSYEFWNRAIPSEPASASEAAHSFQDHGFDEPETSPTRIKFGAPVSALQTEVLVIGGGTSGNAAAYASARLGMRTVCLERGYELGGTNTVGGVTNLWYGKRTKAFEDYYDAMDAKNDGLNAPGFYKGVKKAGATILFGCAVTGVACKGRDVVRVYVTTPLGLAAIEAPRFIDATGDGAVAAWAGAAYTFGGEHDELTLWASFAGYKPGRPEAMRPFLSPCDERSPTDATRFILSMRRNSKITLEQKHIPPPFYLAPRESRHITGGKTLTFLDLLAGRRFKDGVFRVESNPDIKGLATSDAAKAGFIPTNWRAVYQATVPYAAMIPLTLDNVIIAGKAYSATHDALSAARMQRDLCVMGMVAAHALRLAKDKATLLRDIPVAELQTALIAKEMLKPEDISPDDLGFKYTPEEIGKKIVSKSNLDDTLSISAMLCLLPRHKALAALEPHTKKPNDAVHRVLAFLGDRRGTDAYLGEIQKALGEPELSSELFGGTATKHMMPDQGYAPVSALMLGSLIQCRDRRAIPQLVALAGRLLQNPGDLRSAWGYFYTVACGFERLPSAEACTPLKELLASKFLDEKLVRRSGDMRACSNTQGERIAYLRMALNRALLRCGDPEGAINLCAFLDEARLCLARAARSELAAATGTDLRFDADAWRKWIKDNAGHFALNPLTRRFA
jgi:NADPH-dependent 2,4-dienoyl-CoA reductase/sulfur reductase-like enzyme